MPSNKKRIRDIERLLKKHSNNNNENTELIEKLNNELVILRDNNNFNKLKDKERQLSIKYHRVKFFERKKVTRQIHNIEKKLLNNENNNELISEKDQLIQDLVYIMYYPRNFKYIALYAKDKSETSSIKKKKEEARQLAIEAWNEDKENGRDLVEHAIEVHKNPKKSLKLISSKRKIDDDDNSNIDNELLDEENEYLNYNDDINDDDDIIEDTEIVEVDKSDEIIPESTTEKLTQDPFFVEDVIVPEHSITIDNNSNKNNHKRPFNNNTNNRAFNNKKIKEIDTTGLTKQEIRLLQWKQKRNLKRN